MVLSPQNCISNCSDCQLLQYKDDSVNSILLYLETTYLAFIPLFNFFAVVLNHGFILTSHFFQNLLQIWTWGRINFHTNITRSLTLQTLNFLQMKFKRMWMLSQKLRIFFPSPTHSRNNSNIGNVEKGNSPLHGSSWYSTTLPGGIQVVPPNQIYRESVDPGPGAIHWYQLPHFGKEPIQFHTCIIVKEGGEKALLDP